MAENPSAAPTSRDLDDLGGSDWITEAVQDPTDPSGIGRKTSTSTTAPTDTTGRRADERAADKIASPAGESSKEAKRSRADRKAERNQTTNAPLAERSPSRSSRRDRRRKQGWTRRPPRWGGRLLPKSILGISLLMMATGIGAAVAGTSLYMNYQYRRDVSDELVKGFDTRAKNAIDTVEAEGVNARRRIQDEIEPIRKIAATGNRLRELLSQTEKSVWQVNTFDVDGGASVGSAFVVASDSERSFLVTSYDVVRAATVKPGPAVQVRKGSEALEATLWTWQESKDLALLIVNKPSLPRLDWALSSDVVVGTQVFAVSGVGTAGGSIVQGFTADVSKQALQHTSPIGSHFRGGPLVNDRGLVVAIASRTYMPYGFPSDGVWFAAPVRTACEAVVKCPATEVSGAGQVTDAGTQR